MSTPSGLVGLNLINNSLPFIGPSPQWVKVGVGLAFTLFQAAALSSSVNLFNLPAGAIIHAVRLKHSVAFAGAGITADTLSVGTSGTPAKYASAFDVLQAVSATAYQLGAMLGAESYTAPTQITATMSATGANLSALTAGTVDVWCLLSLPN